MEFERKALQKAPSKYYMAVYNLYIITISINFCILLKINLLKYRYDNFTNTYCSNLASAF